MRTFKDGDDGFSSRGANPCTSSGVGGGGGGGVLADFVAHLFGDVAQTLGHRLAFPETLNAAVEESDPAKEQVRVAGQSHGGGGDVRVTVSSSAAQQQGALS